MAIKHKLTREFLLDQVVAPEALSAPQEDKPKSQGLKDTSVLQAQQGTKEDPPVNLFNET